jgi:hypothetical protein
MERPQDKAIIVKWSLHIAQFSDDMESPYYKVNARMTRYSIVILKINWDLRATQFVCKTAFQVSSLSSVKPFYYY